MFTQPQPKYYAYQEELRNNPLIERSIKLITLAQILLIVAMIPIEKHTHTIKYKREVSCIRAEDRHMALRTVSPERC